MDFSDMRPCCLASHSQDAPEGSHMLGLVDVLLHYKYIQTGIDPLTFKVHLSFNMYLMHVPDRDLIEI